MTSIPCPHCGRQISDQSKRCLYCAKPLATDAVGDDAEKRARMLRAMYEAGVGLPTPEKQSWVERQRDEPVLVRTVIALLILPMVLVWPPTWWKWVRTLFRP